MMRWLKWARLIGVLLLIWIVWTIDWRRILPTLASLKPAYLLAYMFCFACMASVRVIRLHLSARILGVPLRLADSYAATVEPMFMGAVTPGRIGEVSRVGYLNRHGMAMSSAIAFVLLERVIDLSVLLCVGASGAVYLFGPAALRPFAFGAIPLLFVVFHFAFLASSFFSPVLERLASRLTGNLPPPVVQRHGRLWIAWRHTVGTAAPLIEGLAVVCTALNLGQIYMLSRAFGFGGNLIPICFAYAVSTLIALLPVSPSGLGTREATYIYILARQGIGKEQALLFSLLDGVVFGITAPLVMVMPLWIRAGIRRMQPPCPAVEDLAPRRRNADLQPGAEARAEPRAMNILTFDVEHWYEGYRYRGIDCWQHYPPRDDRIIGEVLDALAASKQRATMFFTGRYAREFPEVVKRAAAEGHEIGSHSYEHAVLPKLVDLKQFRADLVKSVDLLESVVGTKIRGYRAPKWSISDHSRDAVFGVLAEEGLEYDSSFFPAPFGTARARCVPHQVKIEGGGRIWEIPATTYPVLGLRVPAAGGLYFRALPRWLTDRALSEGSHPGMVYLHPYDLDPDCPRLPGGGVFNRIRYIGIDKAWKRLDRLLRSHNFCTISDWIASRSPVAVDDSRVRDRKY